MKDEVRFTNQQNLGEVGDFPAFRFEEKKSKPTLVKPPKIQKNDNPFSDVKFDSITEFKPPISVEVSSLNKIEPAIFEESKVISY